MYIQYTVFVTAIQTPRVCHDIVLWSRYFSVSTLFIMCTIQVGLMTDDHSSSWAYMALSLLTHVTSWTCMTYYRTCMTYYRTCMMSSVAQAATDVLEVSKKAIERQVTSQVEETLLTLQHTYRETSSIYRTVSKGVRGKVKAGTYTSEVGETLKCKSENRDPYILLRVVCAPQYCNYVYLLVVILIQLLVGNQIEHCMTGQLILIQLLSVS